MTYIPLSTLNPTSYLERRSHLDTEDTALRWTPPPPASLMPTHPPIGAFLGAAAIQSGEVRTDKLENLGGVRRLQSRDLRHALLVRLRAVPAVDAAAPPALPADAQDQGPAGTWTNTGHVACVACCRAGPGYCLCFSLRTCAVVSCLCCHLLLSRPQIRISSSWRFFSEYRQKKKAPEAANILWENLQLSTKERARRKTLTLWVTIALLGASFALLYASNSAEREYSEAGARRASYFSKVSSFRWMKGGLIPLFPLFAA